MRDDHRWIAANVPEGSRVLDLGCGSGELLALLRDTRGCEVRGIEIDPHLVTQSIARGVPVLRVDLDEGLGMFPDHSFDVVILSQTLQVVRRPKFLMNEMLRVGGACVVSYPNFAHWRVRTYLALRGRMPVSDLIPYTWYDTPNIHHTTIRDFRDLVADLGATMRREVVLRNRPGEPSREVRLLKHLRGENIVAVLTR